MATEHLVFTITRRADGFHAGFEHGDDRVFATRDEAERWCRLEAQRMSIDAAPEEGVYGEPEIGIIDREADQD